MTKRAGLGTINPSGHLLQANFKFPDVGLYLNAAQILSKRMVVKHNDDQTVKQKRGQQSNAFSPTAVSLNKFKARLWNFKRRMNNK